MKPPLAPPRSLRDLRYLTPARVGLGRTGASLPTSALLDFAAAHARARDAVHAPFDIAAIVSHLDSLGLETLRVSSRVSGREEYLKRPDLGRRLDAKSCDLLAGRIATSCNLAIVVGDGLSPAAVTAHAPELVGCLIPKLAAAPIAVGVAAIATGARVALGDEIGALLGAKMVVVLIGERPGLSAPDSLGAYITFAPRAGLTDAERNCVSNIHSAGLSYDEASSKIAWLVREGFARKTSGIALKDESGLRSSESRSIGLK